jgi:hypothetical protein
VLVVSDRQQFRGPAGAVKDVCNDLPGDATVLVAEGGRYFSTPLLPSVSDHFERGADVTVVANRDASPAGVFLVRRKWLDLVPDIGFMDLKEQWLGRVAEQGAIIRVHRLREGMSYGLRTREQFLEAARAAGGLVSTIQPPGSDVSTPEGLFKSAATLAEGVVIGRAAVIVDSVVMPGAQIGEGAVVARSVICARGMVGSGETVVDSIVPPTGSAAGGRGLSPTGVRA